VIESEKNHKRWKGKPMKRDLLKFLSLTLFLILLLASRSFAQTVEDCLMCHGDKSLTKEDSTGKEVSLFVDDSVFAKSVHQALSCVGCHVGVKADVHETTPGPVDCGMCHESEQKLYKAGFHWKGRTEGVTDAPTCSDCHGYHNIMGTYNEADPVYRVNEPKTCGRCHAEFKLVSKYHVPAPTPYEGYSESVHGKALENGILAAAVCSDCHRSHDLRITSDPTSYAYPANVPSTCGQCHPTEEEEYSQDVHGSAEKKGMRDAPVCTDCHSTHAIKSSSDETSSTYPANVTRFTCVYCHSREQVLEKYGSVFEKITPNLDMYHGVRSRAGDIEAASCVSCHTSHNIRPEKDPRSSINKANRPQTCGRCHKGAGPHFAEGSLHTVPTSKRDVGVWWVRRIYILLIVMTIGGMLLHNAVIMVRYARERYREAKSGRVVRWTSSEITWHFLLFLSFVTLIITGFAFRYPGAWWSSWLTDTPKAIMVRGVAHRVAGVLLIGLFFYTIFRSVLTKRGWQQLKDKLPVLSDTRNVIDNILFSVGLSSRHPEFDRYDYTEKAEYWALMWGGFVMIITGVILWFENFFLSFIPLWLLDVAKAIHFYEAWLATLAILVWHFFYMFINPENYPINFTVLTGTMTEEAYMERHPLDYERMIARGELTGEEPEGLTGKTDKSEKA
jgi:cytochrome b subunit of formate dehydrogenase